MTLTQTITTSSIQRRNNSSSSSSSHQPSKSLYTPITGPLRSDGRGFYVNAPPLGQTQSPTIPVYSWEEVSRHTTPESCWVYCGHRVFDITDWLDRHPGGREHLLLAAGRDITELLVSYHPFTDKAHILLEKYYIGELKTSEFPQYLPDTGFYSELRKEVGNYFERNHLDYKDPKGGLIRLAGILSIAAISYFLLIYNHGSLPLSLRVLAALVFGVCQALPLLHCMHDASHTSIGHNPFYWSLIGRGCLDWFAGGSLNSWHHQHVIGHHLYTNVPFVDPDLPSDKEWDIRRVTIAQKWLPYYKFQVVYLCVLYGLLAFKSRIQDVIGTLYSHRSGVLRINDSTVGLQEIISQCLTKGFWFTYRFIIPLYYLDVSPLSFLLLSLLIEFTTGYYLTVNFQVSHISPPAHFPLADHSLMQYQWAASQLLTTVDYAHNEWFVTFLCGALNYQSVHHLFPSVSQYYYPEITPIVKKVAAKYNIPYTYVGTFSQAFYLHLKHLMDMGKENLHPY